ncbi:UDP-N-acetylglucosamine acyltransferase [Planktothricoides sp. SR001]|nr:acyl-ACP--UDP-N-acetylglucosamine O-acyltransferase [Planktothricoides sp. SR001]KOR38204.1 UDP-N-acetylglucosamine acyltransferase [Planktothricoides sp. SR001]
MINMIHTTASIHPEAELDPTVEVGPFCVIGKNVKIGKNTKIYSHVVIDGHTEIGEDNRIFPGAALGTEPQDLKYKGAISFTKIGNGNTIREYVTINRATGEGESTTIGDHNLLMAYAHVAHNCAIENHVVMANSVNMAGHVHIESRAVIGGVTGIHQFVHIGQLAMIAGCSRIINDIPPYMLVEGSPSRVRVLNTVGLKRAGISAEESQSLKKAFRILYRSGLSLKEALEQLNLIPENPYLTHLSDFITQSLTEDRRGLTPGKFENKIKNI